MRKLLALFETFIPANVRKNPADLMRAYILVGVVFMNVITGILCTIGIYAALELPLHTKAGIASALVLMNIGYIATLLVFRRTANHRVAGNFLISSLLFVISYPVFLSGGFNESPIVPVLSILPVMGFLLLGLRSGLLWLLATALWCIALSWMAEHNLFAIQMVPDEHSRHLLRIGLQVIFMASNCAALLVYEIMNERLKLQLHAERNEFEQRASHDSLTGIPNRFEFFRRLGSGMIECQDRKQKLAVLYIDLNGFKPINDRYGHQAGDQVLQTIAKRLQQTLRLSDTAARLGGDEFGLVLPGIHVPEDLLHIRTKVLQAVREPIKLADGNIVEISASMGAAIFPDDATEMNLLCSHADEAMYQNKASQNK